MIIRFANCTCCCPSACCAGLVYCARMRHVMFCLSSPKGCLVPHKQDGGRCAAHLLPSFLYFYFCRRR